MNYKFFYPFSVLVLATTLYFNQAHVADEPIVAKQADVATSEPSNKLTPAPKKGGELLLKEINKNGFEFYQAVVADQAAALQGVEESEKVSLLMSRIDFPKRLAKNMIFFFANKLGAADHLLFSFQNGDTVKVLLKTPSNENSGAVYARNDPRYKAVVVDDGIFHTSGPIFDNMIIHELGHRISDELTMEEWKDYFRVRNIPSSTPIYNTIWKLSPDEDFADVYRHLIAKRLGGEGSPSAIRTYYGELVPAGLEAGCLGELLEAEGRTSSPDKASVDKKVQECRLRVLTGFSGEKFKQPPYQSAVGEAEKIFMDKILDRLGQAPSTP